MKKWQGMKWIRAEKRLAIYIRDGFVCGACGRDLRTAKAGDVALDHLRPRCQGGSNDASNLMTICKPCNSARGDKKWTTFYPAGAHARVQSNRRRRLNIALAKAIIEGRAGDPRSEAQR